MWRKILILPTSRHRLLRNHLTMNLWVARSDSDGLIDMRVGLITQFDFWMKLSLDSHRQFISVPRILYNQKCWIVCISYGWINMRGRAAFRPRKTYKTKTRKSARAAVGRRFLTKQTRIPIASQWNFHEWMRSALWNRAIGTSQKLLAAPADVMQCKN